MMRPIEIYLDSSDFSDLSNLESKAPEYREVGEYLLRMRNEGLINMRFSEAHVVEVAPTVPSAIPAARARFQTIKALCGKNSLLHPIDLIAREVSQAGHGVFGQEGVLRSDGAWLPKLFDVSDIIPDVEQFVRDDVRGRGRAEQRKYLRNGRPSAKWYSEMREANIGMGAAVANNLPLKSVAVRTIQKYFTGEATRKDALKALHDSIIDLEVVGDWYQKDWSAASAMSGHLRDIGVQFQQAMREARTQFEALMQTHAISGEDSKKLLSLSVKAFHEVLEGSSASLANAMAVQIGAEPKPMDNPWRSAPGLTCSTNLAMHVARRSVASMNPRAPGRSDFPDAYHAVYLPYVDIFRADGFMASVLGECKLPFPTVIAEKFLLLPIRIQEVLDSRRCDVKTA